MGNIEGNIKLNILGTEKENASERRKQRKFCNLSTSSAKPLAHAKALVDPFPFEEIVVPGIETITEWTPGIDSSQLKVG